MTWSPGPRPGWVQHALDGAGGPVYEAGRRAFVADELVAEAAFRAGSDEWLDDSFREPLDVLAPSLDHEAGLHLVGRWRAREVVLRSLENRLRVTEAFAKDPGLADERIEAPLIVTGSPRAGTSIMHQLLSLAPSMRAPVAWEYWSPAPPPRPELGDADPRVALADRDVRLSAALAPMFDGMHEQGAKIPREDASAMNLDLRSDVLATHYGVPSYRVWLADCDMRTAYEWHRRVLQVLQRHHGPRRWVTKWPTHVSHLRLLLETYPDARVVVCHRDPLVMLSSVTSLTATLRWAHAENVDIEAVGREQAEVFAAQCDRLVDADRLGVVPSGRIVHVHFADFMADQTSTVAKVHESLGLPFGADDERRVREHLAAKPRGRLGGHEHSFAQIGLDRSEQRRRFAKYQEHFGIEPEPDGSA